MADLAKIFNLKEGEGKFVLLPMIYSFFVGAALSFFVTSATSLFLSSFEREFLPISFIAAGVLVWLVGKLLKLLQSKLDFTKSLPAGIGFLLITIVVLLVLYSLFEFVIIIFLLYAWIRVFAYIHAVSFWSLAGRLFSLRQAKRVFGLITGGEVFASILSFFSVPLLLKFLSTSQILLISGAFLALGFIFLLYIVGKFKPQLSVKKSAKKTKKDNSLSFGKSKYYRLIFLIAFIPIFAQFFVDFIFQAQAKVEFPDREELTAFVGVFFGLSAIVEFILKTFVSGRLLNQYGVKLGLLVFPVVLLISFFLASVFGAIFGATGLFFSFVTMGRLFTRAVRTSFNDPATQILYQPLDEQQRLVIQNKIESGPKAYASIVAGVFLLGFAQIPNISLVIFALMLFAVTIYWIRVALKTFKEYKIKIQSVLEKTEEKQTISNLERLKIYMDTLVNTDFGFKSFVNLLFGKNKTHQETTKYKLSELVKFANSENPEQRKLAAVKLSRFSIYKTEKLYVKLLNDEDFNVRSQAIMAVGENKHKELFDNLLYNFKLKAYRDVVFQSIEKIGDPILPDLIRLFSTFDYDYSIQIQIIEKVEKSGSEKAIEFLRKLIYHHNRLIKDRAFHALGALNYTVNKQETLKANELLEEKINSYVYLAASILDMEKSDDSEKYRMIIEALDDKKFRQKEVVYVILSVLYDTKAINLIKENIENGNENAKGFALEVADTIIPEVSKKLLLPFFESETNQEIVRKYRFDYPQEKFSLSKRLMDIVNSDISITGSFVKVEALAKLADFQDNEIETILKANIMHPIEYVREVAAVVLNQKNSKLFEETININKFNKRFLISLAEKIKVTNQTGNMMIFEKIDLLKTIPNFEKMNFPDLFSIASESREIIIRENENITIDSSRHKKSYIVMSGRLKNKNQFFEAGDVLSSFLISGEQKIELTAEEQTMFLTVPFYNLNSLFLKNYDFIKDIIENKVLKIA